MAIVRRTIGRELTPEKAAAMKAEIEAAARRPYTYPAEAIGHYEVLSVEKEPTPPVFN